MQFRYINLIFTLKITLSAGHSCNIEQHKLCCMDSIRDHVFTCSFLVEAGKRITNDFLRVGAVKLLSKHREKHSEVYGPGSFGHHCLQIVIFWVLP